MQEAHEIIPICHALPHVNLDWEIHRRQFAEAQNSQSITEYETRISESWLQKAVAEAIQIHGTGEDLHGEQIGLNHESKRYLFQVDERKRLVALRKSGHRGATDYDDFALINGKPVAFEIKIVDTWKRLKEAFRPGEIKRKLRPLEDLFGQEAVYVLVIPKEIYNLRENGPPCQTYEDFKKSNGLVVPFCTSSADFRVQVLTNILENSWPVEQDQSLAHRTQKYQELIDCSFIAN